MLYASVLNWTEAIWFNQGSKTEPLSSYRARQLLLHFSLQIPASRCLLFSPRLPRAHHPRPPREPPATVISSRVQPPPRETTTRAPCRLLVSRPSTTTRAPYRRPPPSTLPASASTRVFTSPSRCHQAHEDAKQITTIGAERSHLHFEPKLRTTKLMKQIGMLNHRESSQNAITIIVALKRETAAHISNAKPSWHCSPLRRRQP